MVEPESESTTAAMKKAGEVCFTMADLKPRLISRRRPEIFSSDRKPRNHPLLKTGGCCAFSYSLIFRISKSRRRHPVSMKSLPGLTPPNQRRHP